MNSIHLKLDSFNTLLTSLNKSEKRYLELYLLQDHSLDSMYQVYLKAYKEALKNRQGYIELPLDFPINRLPSVKNYLKKKILSALGNFHQKSIRRNEILEYLKSVEVLFNKRLYRECGSLLRQLEKMALQFWSYNLLLEILQWQLRLLLSNGYNGELKISLSDLYKKEKKLLHSLNQISFYREIRYKLLKIYSQKKLTNPIDETHIVVIKEMLCGTMPKNLLPYASLECYRTMSLYFRLISDYENAYIHSKNEMAIWNENSIVFKDRIMTSKYINGHVNQCEILFFLEEYGQYEEKFQELQSNVNFKDDEHNNYVHHLAQSYLLKLSTNLITHKYSNNSLLISEIKSTFLSKINKQKKAEFIYIFAINSFCQKKWNDCLHYTNTLINEYKGSNNTDFDCLSQFFRILVHFELDNIEVVENLIHRFNYQITEMSSLFECFHLYFRNTKLDGTLSSDLLHEIKIGLSKKKIEHQLYLKLYFFVFSNWINSKLTN